MDKKVLMAAALSIFILLMWGTIFPPPQKTPAPVEQIEGELQQPPSGTAASREVAEPYRPPAEVGGSEGEPAIEGDSEYAEALRAESSRTILVETDTYLVELTNEGGRATSWKLRDQLDLQGNPLELLPSYVEAAPMPLGLRVDDPSLTRALNEALYQVEQSTLSTGGKQVRFRWSDGAGLSADKAFTFHDGSYVVDVEVNVVDRGRRLPAELTVGPGFGAQEKNSSYYYEAWVWDRAGEAVHEQKGKRGGYSEEALGLSGASRWAGLEDQYFAALVMPDTVDPNARINVDPIELTRLPFEGSDDKIKPQVEVVLSVPVPQAGAGLYVGPKIYRQLESMDKGLEGVVWFFKNSFLAWISKQIYFGLLWLYANVAQNYGVAIVMATFILRMLLFPVNQYSMVRMKKTQIEMSRLQPKIKNIRSRYKDKKDAESRGKMNQEMMALYKQEGVNPMGGVTGCLPMLAQFPILIGFYGMLTVAVELRGAPFFGWIQDLSRADPMYVTPLLMGVTMFVQQMMAMSKVKDPMQQQQQRFMMIMPVVFTVICVNLPSGLVLYWFVNNLLGIGQQWLVNRHTGKLESGDADGPPKAKTAPSKDEKAEIVPAKHPLQGKGRQSGSKKKIAR
jgi:YidC/Oxa1 family membrane protein insertase